MATSSAENKNQAAETDLPVEDINSESPVSDIVEWIREGIEEERIGSDIIRVIMDIPPLRRIPGVKVLDALNEVLVEYSVKLPDDVTDAIRNAISGDFSFSAPAKEKHLRPRTVMVNTAPEVCTLMISGEEPEDGEPGFIETHYDFNIKSGKLLPDGSIDFREINRFPQARKGDLLLKIFEPTDGLAGTDVYGWRVAPKPGAPVRVELGDNLTLFREYEKEEKRHVIDVTAGASGIIVTDFGGAPPAPENIKSIAIQNCIELNDIDFTTGNISGGGEQFRCTADVKVKGDIRGLFSVIIDGTLEVGGTIEGQRIDASGGVVAQLVRSTVRSGKFISTLAATNARLIAQDFIRISREFTHCTLVAPKVEFRHDHGRRILGGRAVLHTEKLEARNIDVRNRLEVILGENLLKQKAALEKSKLNLEKALLADENHLKGRVQTFAQKMQLTYTLLPENLKKTLLGIKKFASGILGGSVAIDGAKADLEKLFRSLGPEFHPLLDQIKRIITIQETRQEKASRLETVEEQLKEIKNSLCEMKVEITGRLHPLGHIVITFGNFEEKRVGETDGVSSIEIFLGVDPDNGFIPLPADSPNGQ